MKVLKSLFLIAAIILISFSKSNATHMAGLEIFYRWVSDSTYEFTLVFYRNCEGFTAGAPNVMSINASSMSTATYNSFTLLKLPISGTGVPSLIPPNIYECLDTNYCVEEYVYRGNWTSPVRARDWEFSYSLCCLPVMLAPANMQNGTLYNECGLNNLDFPDTIHKNRSPIFHNRRPNHPGFLNDTIFNPPNVSICEGRNVYLNESTREYDGDLVKYERFWPQTTGGSLMGYINGWSDSIPLPYTSTSFAIDSITGVINFTPGTPTATGFYLTGVKATEYRLDTTVSPSAYKEIGFVKRNLMITIEDSISCPGGLFTFSDTSGSGIDTNQIVFDCAPSTFDLNFTADVKCESIDTNASCIKMWHASSGSPIPVKKLWGSNCNIEKTSTTISVTLDTIMYADTFKLVFLRGSDGNTIKTNCYDELEPYADTLTIVFLEQPQGEFVGDLLSPSVHSSTINIACRDTNFVLYLSEPILCGSVDRSGLDFELLNSNGIAQTIHKAKPICNGGWSEAIAIHALGLDPDQYLLRFKKSPTDVQNICGAPYAADSIVVNSIGLNPDLGNDTTYCLEDTLFFMALHPGNFHKYLWDNFDTLPYRPVVQPGVYTVAVFNKYNCVDIDTIVVSAIECYAGLNKMGRQEFKIYPNPTQDMLNVEILNAIGHEVIELYSTLGDRVLAKDVGEHNKTVSLDLNGMNPGVYILKVSVGNEIIRTERIIYKGN